MKPSEFKKIIKESVKEAIQEELKDILLEAVRSSKQIVKEAYNPPPRTVESQVGMDQIMNLLNNK